MHGLGRKPSPPDSRDYKLRDHLKMAWPDFATDTVLYGLGPTLDQRSTPHCVGFSCAAWSNAEPVINDYDDEDGHDIYYECVAIDGRPGTEEGSYVRSGAKALKKRGRLDGYAFGSILEARRFMLQGLGPVVFGIDWYEGQFYPDAAGVIRPTGELCGGHAILAYGADPVYCHFVNSWGKDWGLGGTCKMTWADLESIFGEYGEAMAAVELPLDHVPEPESFWTRVWRWLLSLFTS